MNNVLTGIIATAIASGTVIALAALGELLAEISGVQNLGLEGVMAMGALTAIAADCWLPNPYFSLFTALVVGLILGVIYATVSVTFRANQVLCGLGLGFFGTGLSARLGAPLAGFRAPAPFLPLRIPLPPVISFVINHTKHGMQVRAVGENPSAADACGVSVNKIRFLYTSIGCMFAAIGGAYITLAFTPSWVDGITAGRGWIAIALVIFGTWKPLPVVLGALLFGAVSSLGFVVQLQGWGIPANFLSMLPYLGTILLMVIPIVFKPRALRNLSTNPRALGVPYIREGE